MAILRIQFLLAMFALFLGSASHAHEGHDHGDAPIPLTIITAPRASANSPLFELVAVLDGTTLRLFLDRFDTNEPVTGARIDVETPQGPATATAAGEIYTLDAPWAAEPGSFDLLFTIGTTTESDFLTATLEVPPVKAPAAEAPPRFLPGLTDGLGTPGAPRAMALAIGTALAGFFFGAVATRMRRSRAGQSAMLLALVFLAAGSTYAQAQTTPGQSPEAVVRDVAQRLPDARIFAPKPAQRILAIRTDPAVMADHKRRIDLPGRVIPDPNRSGFVQTAVGGRLLPPPGGFPSLGATVSAGQLMAFVEPTLGAADLSNIRQSKAALDQDIALAERKIERIRQLSRSGTASKSELEEAELTLAGLRLRRTALDSIRMEPEKLLAPVSGIVSKANAAPGLIAETNTEVFHIIDPLQLWVEAYAFTKTDIGTTASVRTPAGSSVTLAFVGAGFAEDGQAQPLHFSLDPQGSELSPGDRVTVLAETSSVVQGIAVRREAVIRGQNGESMVFVHSGPEIFEPRPVRTAPLDGTHVIILAGITEGDRIVTQGAELLNQLR